MQEIRRAAADRQRLQVAGGVNVRRQLRAKGDGFRSAVLVAVRSMEWMAIENGSRDGVAATATAKAYRSGRLMGETVAGSVVLKRRREGGGCKEGSLVQDGGKRW
jgi:hypothetical protein